MSNSVLSPRLAALRNEIMERKGSYLGDVASPFCCDVALWKALAVGQGRSRIQNRAAMLVELVKLAPLFIHPGWGLAGEHLPMANGAGGSNYGFLRPDADARLGRLAELGVAPGDVESVRAAVSNWYGKGWPGAGHEYASVGEQNETAARGLLGDQSERVIIVWGWIENHSVRGYEKVLNHGFSGLKEQVQAEHDTLDLADKDAPRKDNVLRAFKLVCEAGELLGRRYAELAEAEAAKASDPAQKARLERMAAACRHVPAHGARTFFEAVQSLWLAHVLTCGEDGINANSIGRMDQLLNPFYEADLKAGRVTREEAVELMEELACKLYLEYDVQAVTLGGLDAQGDSAVNPMSHIILEATDNVDFIRDLSVRLNSKTPDDFLKRVAGMITKGGGIPFVFNDDCFVKAMNDRGVSLEDARGYAPIGCVELTIPGKANPRAVSGWLNSLKCLELALFGGVDPQSGKQIGAATPALADLSDYQAFRGAYDSQVDFFLKNLIYGCNCRELQQREKGPLPYLSLLTDDCVKRGRDLTDGGARYDYHSICFVGAADTADALMAVKQLVYEQKKVKPTELLAALKGNFGGHESLRQALLSVPKYGNAVDEVDLIAKGICDRFIDELDKLESPSHGRYFAQLFSFLLNIHLGKNVGATPDGRLSEEPLAYSLSAHQGRDEQGVTSMLRSLSRLPHDRAAAASAAIIDLTPKLVEGEEGKERMAQILRAALAMGIGQVQFNVVTAERLKQAKADPLNYGNIPVRVAGYSQMFKLLPDELQNHVIARTKHEN